MNWLLWLNEATFYGFIRGSMTHRKVNKTSFLPEPANKSTFYTFQDVNSDEGQHQVLTPSAIVIRINKAK